MIRSVDLVIFGDGSTARTAAVDALQRGRRVLVVLRSGEPRVVRRLRKCLCRSASVAASQVTVMTGAEVVCVYGVDGVEAVVIRYAQTGRLRAVNASSFLSCEGSTNS